MKVSPIYKFMNCQLMPVRSGVRSVHHLLAAQMRWLNLIIELATVSIIHVQK